MPRPVLAEVASSCVQVEHQQQGIAADSIHAASCHTEIIGSFGAPDMSEDTRHMRSAPGMITPGSRWRGFIR